MKYLLSHIAIPACVVWSLIASSPNIQSQEVRTNVARLNTASAHEFEYQAQRQELFQLDYSRTSDQTFSILKRFVRDISKKEFEKWIAEGRFETSSISGQIRFSDRSVGNLVYRYPDVAARYAYPSDYSELKNQVLADVRSIKREARQRRNPVVLPKRFSVMISVKVNAGVKLPSASRVRAWIPIPLSTASQFDVVLKSQSPLAISVSDASDPFQCVYSELMPKSNQPVQFDIRYEYSSGAVSYDIVDSQVQQYNPADSSFSGFLREGPHVTISDSVRSLVLYLSKSTTNPAQQARLFYNWISENIKYGAPPRYNLTDDIGNHCLFQGYGDCAHTALLFITLCRSAGIPARWQSGWITRPKATTVHAWSEILLPSYGWIPVDPYMGIFAMQYFPGPLEERKEIRDFYFGGLDQYRLLLNSDHNQELEPTKRFPRSDRVGFQYAELETDSANIDWRHTQHTIQATVIRQ